MTRSGLPVGVLILTVALALGAIAVGLAVIFRQRRRAIQKRREQRRQWDRARLLYSLETLDLSLTRLTAAALQGSTRFAQERADWLAQATEAVGQSGDGELRRLMEILVARCDALGAAGREGKSVDPLVQQLGEAQREVYRRMEALLDEGPG